MKALKWKEAALKELLEDCGSALVAFSGGIDSLLLAYLTKKILGDRYLAVTAASPIRQRRNIERARRWARMLGLRHLVIKTDELSLSSFMKNDRDRCYHCKDHMLQRMSTIAAEHRLKYIFDGTNRDDLRQYRPGLEALKRWGAISPFVQCGIGKGEIRMIAKRLRLPGWKLPPDSCLATRIPYGVPLNRNLLTRIEKSEDNLVTLGFTGFRVRHHGELARIEVDPNDFQRALRKRREIVHSLRGGGYRFVTLDLGGYQMGGFDR